MFLFGRDFLEAKLNRDIDKARGFQWASRVSSPNRGNKHLLLESKGFRKELLSYAFLCGAKKRYGVGLVAKALSGVTGHTSECTLLRMGSHTGEML